VAEGAAGGERRERNEDVRVVDAPQRDRYELHIDGVLAGVIEYRTTPGGLALVHTEVDPAFEGRGLSGRLIAGALGDVRSRGLRIRPLCAVVAGYIRRHPEYLDLVETRRPGAKPPPSGGAP
jgi:predicted GNAT family acetyltransferase